MQFLTAANDSPTVPTVWGGPDHDANASRLLGARYERGIVTAWKSTDVKSDLGEKIAACGVDVRGGVFKAVEHLGGVIE